MKPLMTILLLMTLNSFADTFPERNLPPLHLAVIHGDLDEVKRLLNKGADINQMDRKMGNTPLIIAAQTDHTDIVKFLIKNGAFVNVQSPRSGFSPLITAAWYSKIENVKELLKAEDINVNLKTPQGLMAEQWIGGWDTDLDENEKELISRLKKVFEDYRKSLNKKLAGQKLIQAVLDPQLTTHQKTEKVKKLIQAGVNVNEIQSVIGNGNDFHSPLLISARSGYTKIVEILLQHGADQTLPGYMMNAVAFHKAAYKGHPEILKLLLKDKLASKVINDVGPNNGYTPLHDAIWHGNTEAAKVLIDAGARLDLKNYEGETPLMLAERYKHKKIVEYLKNKSEQ